MRLRFAVDADAATVAALHADSWQRHYRGIYTDAFLDGDLRADRLALWTDRMHEEGDRYRTTIAEVDETPAGFAHVVFEHDPTWGALLSNLHVAHAHQHRGVGTALLADSTHAALERGTGLYLWVQQLNVAAQGFYLARGAQHVESASSSSLGGNLSRLEGDPVVLRYAWPGPA